MGWALKKLWSYWAKKYTQSISNANEAKERMDFIEVLIAENDLRLKGGE